MTSKQPATYLASSREGSSTSMSLEDRAGEWGKGRGSVPFQIGLASFGILALELALIRWTAGQVRLFAYFTNLILIGAFLGMGLGVAVGRRRPELLHRTLPALAVLSVIFGAAEPLHLLHLSFPDSSVHLWGAEGMGETRLRLLLNLGIFLVLFAGIVGVFFLAGTSIGWLFPRTSTLKAYRADLTGSLLGVLAMTATTATGAGPAAWLALAVLPFAWLSRRWSSLVAAAVVISMGAFSTGRAVFSPYNRIDMLGSDLGIWLEVNRDFHQYMHDLSDRALAQAASERERSGVLKLYRAAYDLPFEINEHRGSALVLGAGTGNDAEAALRNGYRHVTSVDIDGKIIDLGRRYHPEKPYDDPRVDEVVDDARAFFHSPGTYDAVVYGLLDSHAMFSSLASLRLDNYVYTEEGIRAAWQHVSRNGHLSISFSLFGGNWIGDRMYWTITRATEHEPLTYCPGMHYGCTFIVAREGAQLTFRGVEFPRFEPAAPMPRVRTASDDWPFLYIRPGVFPWGYLFVLAIVIVMALVATPLAFGREQVGADFDVVLFFMGAAFLLIETRGVTALSLLFGSTWVVNAAVFSGILIMALVANEVVQRLQPSRLGPWFAGLLAAVVLVWAVPPGALNALPLVVRGLAGGLLNALPVGFAGVIVSISLARAPNPSASLGSNLLGSVVGGCLEYLSMVIGLRALVLLALALYLAALLAWVRRDAVFAARAVAAADA
jgi:spermine/spermidine synthase